MSDEYVLVSVDMESTGLSPATGNMISLGACTTRNTGELFYVNIDDLYPGLEDPSTMEWWKTVSAERWEETRINRLPPRRALELFSEWTRNLRAKPIFVAWPASFDFAWVDYYYKKIGLENPYGYKPLDLASFAAGLIGDPLQIDGSRSKGTSRFPEDWSAKAEREHNALSDAMAQRDSLLNMLKYARRTCGQTTKV